MADVLKILVFLLLAVPAFSQNKKIFVITDAEGVAGVCRQDQTDPKNTEMQQLLTGEINAAVQGFFDGGATEVDVWDGHDGSQTLSALTIHPKARLIMGALSATMLLERKYDGVAFIGQHGRANSPGGVMAHSYSSLGLQNMLMNGKPVGEIETRTALAGWYGTPVFFLTGDQVAAEQLKAIVPQATTVEVKEGLNNYACISMSAQAAREAIRGGAQRAMQNLSTVKPYRVEGPVTLQTETTSRSALGPDMALRPGVKVLDARTVVYQGKDFLEAWQRYRMP